MGGKTIAGKRQGAKSSERHNPYEENLLGVLPWMECCPGGSGPLYREDDDTNPDPWNAPTHDPKGRKLTPLMRYRLHERAFFHALGIHDDSEIARRLNVEPITFQRVLRRMKLPTNFRESPEREKSRRRYWAAKERQQGP